jgi:CRISPR-associated helicase Cas3
MVRNVSHQLNSQPQSNPGGSFPAGADLLRVALRLREHESPFPWQAELLERFRQDRDVGFLDIPTGLGKTAVIAIWLVARALRAKLPRRLVYVVDRRAVVDQATDVAESLRAWVAEDLAVAGALGLGDRPLPISTLRGQYVDNRAWLDDPSSPAIVVGTIDMVGSRLLFSGYGVSSKMRPYHAGLLGADTLVVLDEAHLAPAFEDLLRHIEREANSFGPSDSSLRALVPPFKFLSLSATGRQNGATTLTLSHDDRGNPIVKRRLTAQKVLSIVDLANVAEATATPDDGESADEASEATRKNKIPKLPDELARQAWQLTTQGSDNVRCLVFCNARKDATLVAAALRNMANSTSANEPIIELFVGGRRVKERILARDALARLGFLAGTSVTFDRSAFLIATSAGEVGVDLDADHMICDLVAWERMVQRLGRVNRRGDGNAKVVVVVGPEPQPPTQKAKDALEEKVAKRADAQRARDEIVASTLKRDQLVRDYEMALTESKVPFENKLTCLRADLADLPKGKQRTAADKSKADTLKEREEKLKKELKIVQDNHVAQHKEVLERLGKQIKQAKNRIKAFKDVDAKVVARHEQEVAKHQALRKLLDAARADGADLSPDALLKLRERPDLADALRAATTVEPLRPELTRPLVDAWSMTSLDEHSGRPEVDPWLRGFRPNDPPQTTVVWRRYLPVCADGTFDATAATRFFEAAPPHTSEHLETETFLVREWLIERCGRLFKADGEEAGSKIVAIGLSTRGEVKQWWTLKALAALAGDDAKELEASLLGLILVVDARLGGLVDGLLSLHDDPSLVGTKTAADKAAEAATRAADSALLAFSRDLSAARDAEVKLVAARERASAPNAKTAAQGAVTKAEEKARVAREAAQVASTEAETAEAARTEAAAVKEAAERALESSSFADAADSDFTAWLARPDAAGVPVTGFRIRELGASDSEDAGIAWSTSRGKGWVRRHLFVTKVVDGEPSAALAIDGWSGIAATEEERGEADRPQKLEEHQNYAVESASEIARRLGLETMYEDLLVLAARLHDEGKRSERWQRAFKAPIDSRPYAKTTGPIDFDILDGYRHELGSLTCVEANDEFKALGADDQDFVLHLIAAHHGFARPVIGTSGCDDAPPSMVNERARAVALRFARLSKRWGPWGLAWWESLLRAADQIASRRNQHAANEPKEKS